MKDPQPTPVRRLDYAPPSHLVDTVDLVFELAEAHTLVTARLGCRRNPEAREPAEALRLDGELLELLEIELDGKPLGPNAYTLTKDYLEISGPLPEQFELQTRVRIKPQENTAFSGLYRSSSTFCTQCEAQGFRRITYMLDRPDVMSRYTTQIIADATRYPVLLSNGNRVASEALEDGRHSVRWEDPFPKPTYLFALVGGDLRAHAASFTTRSGREVRLEIWVEPHEIDKCDHALQSLANAMRWDEEVFGLEYDLDIYMILAVHDFNMGAMENKGLNIFNSKYVLAALETATDDDYEGVEAVVGHEYFHNWTGNRVTCRDWFQLTLKEGLTVFRDQQFTADMTSAAVKRIDDVRGLRIVQFAEDRGPMAHPIRPDAYVEMNNFYTSTVYNKGAEVIRMYHTLLGAEGFRRGMDLYFERHDGQAVTCDDFRAAMADANQADLEQFERWYVQAGTPQLHALGTWADGRYTLTLTQSGPPSLGEQSYLVRHMPVSVGLLGPDGNDLPLRLEGEDQAAAVSGTRVLELRESEQQFVFVDLPAKPVVSVLRGFSAPVELHIERSREELAFLMANDSDAFNRWDAGQRFATDTLLAMVGAIEAGAAAVLDPLFVDSWGAIAADDALDGSLKALALDLPDERVLGQAMSVVAVDAIHHARAQAMASLGRAHHDLLLAAHQSNVGQAYDASRESIARRRLANTALAFLCASDPKQGGSLARQQFDSADNMTDRQAALACLVELPGEARDHGVLAFHEQWRSDPLVLDKWFAVQARAGVADTLERVLALRDHADFDRRNPNRARALLGTFAQRNQAHFHAADGRGYRLLADEVIAIDQLNPQVAARLVSAFNSWRRFDSERQALLREQLERIAASPTLSKDVGEIVGRALAVSHSGDIDLPG
ncbi:Membrane alanine aminopeptidase N [Enhygromyxa salina]|uniref:Aminopeptidase N n=1 Tax=Enhygromyxa salina TaxID=215803 RepID=A0A0C2DE74_9BACT|nr:aminopeptidase N [Enhygromyxa salina]KIG17962.1 Membrane alanine aminopeptidase N [Enhygromyxa salina]